MKTILISIVILAAFILAPLAMGEDANEMIDQFKTEFDALKPQPNSSVNSDYKLSQVALGSLYTIQTLGRIYNQNEVLLSKYDELLKKYDVVIEQNREIIKLLKIIAKPTASTNP